MRYVSVPEWCPDCAWAFSGRKGTTEMHTYPCNCVCHHPKRIEQRLNAIEQRLVGAGTEASFDQPGDW